MKYGKKIVQGVEGMNGTGPPHRNYRGTGFKAEHVIVGAGGHGCPVQKGFHLAGEICTIDR